MNDRAEASLRHFWPDWVPDAAVMYLAHTEMGRPIRALARASGCHASTVLRQVRRVETQRDDPLIDAALRHLGALKGGRKAAEPCEDQDGMTALKKAAPPPDDTTLLREARRILRRLCEPGAVLAVATEMDKAVVVRDTPDGQSARTAVVDTPVAQAMALKGWIGCPNPGRISRYRITPAGRSELNRLVAAQESRLRGFAESQAGFDTGRAAEDALNVVDSDPRNRRARYVLAESPLLALSRRRDKDGTPFLSEALVAAGDRLREDYELSQLASQGAQDWDSVMAGRDSPETDRSGGATAAHDRLYGALRELGPGLGDVALRCCCLLEGLETTEKRLGWSARSGKIVLRIALQRLRRHYDERAKQGGDLIG